MSNYLFTNEQIKIFLSRPVNSGDLYFGFKGATSKAPNCPTCLKGNYFATYFNLSQKESEHEIRMENIEKGRCVIEFLDSLPSDIRYILNQGESLHYREGKPQEAKIYVIDELRRLGYLPSPDNEVEILEQEVRALCLK